MRAAYYICFSWQENILLLSEHVLCDGKTLSSVPRGGYSFASNCCQWINKDKSPLPFVQQWTHWQHWAGSTEHFPHCYKKTQVQSNVLQKNWKNPSKTENIYKAMWTVQRSHSSGPVCLQLKALIIFSERSWPLDKWRACPQPHQVNCNVLPFSGLILKQKTSFCVCFVLFCVSIQL